jgi:hypothetical protein
MKFDSKENYRHFNFSYHELYEQCLEKLTYFLEDIDELSKIGFTSERVQKFKTSIDQLAETKEEILFIKIITEKTLYKDTKRKQLEKNIEEIIRIVQYSLVNKPSISKSFGFYGAKRLCDKELILAVENLVEKATKHFILLEASGLQFEKIQQLYTLKEEFRDLIESIEVEADQQFRNGSEKLRIGNALYDEMVTLCMLAGNYFEDKDFQKYTNYVIYNLNSSEQRRSGCVLAKSVVSRNFESLMDNTCLNISNEGITNLDFYFLDQYQNDNPVQTVITVFSNQKSQVKAKDLGYDLQENCTVFHIRNSHPFENGFYKIYIEG